MDASQEGLPGSLRAATRELKAYAGPPQQPALLPALRRQRSLQHSLHMY